MSKFVLDDGIPFMARHKFDEIPNQSRGVESDEDQVVLDLSDNGSEDDNGFNDNPSSSSNMDGEENRPLLFNRRERLDVKKPGPYWPQMSGIDRALFENQVLLSRHIFYSNIPIWTIHKVTMYAKCKDQDTKDNGPCTNNVNTVHRC